MAINALIAQGIDPIGRDLPQVGNMLQQMQQRQQQNALAQQQAGVAQQNAEQYRRSLDMQSQAREQDIQAQRDTEARQWISANYDTVKAKPEVMPQLLAFAKARKYLPPDFPSNATLDDVALHFGVKPPAPIQQRTVGDYKVLTQGDTVIPGSVDKPANPTNPPADMYAPVTLADGTVGAFDKRRGTLASTGQQAKPTGNAANPMQLRKEFDQQQAVKDFKAALPVLISARRAPDNGAGDLDVIYAVGKTLDPGSVVREGELTLVIKSGTMLSQMFGAGRFQLGQGGRISPEQRQQLLGMLNERVGAYRQSYDQARQQYSGYAQESGFKPEQVVGPHPANAFAQPKPSKPAPPSVPPDIAAILQKHGSK